MAGAAAAVSSARRGAVTVAGEGSGLPRAALLPAAAGRPPGAGVTAFPRAGTSDMAVAQPRPAALGGKPGRAAEGSAMEAVDSEERLLLTQRLKAAVHYTVGCLCQDVAEDKDMQFSKQAIAAISEITFRQCDNFAKDLEMFARHAKRSTVNTEDVKLLARRSNSLLKYITQKSEELASNNMEQKEKKKKKSGAAKGARTGEHPEAAVTESEDSNMA